ncbi:DUF6152 family protein [Actinomadura viridis]|uniref:Uncharacterized protein n=1 Tax=Actinomadura viridis TaxID=58110 RepID=A0A931DE21_9ACTN|nr:DUF6152 family protein [Actinomadura viridis]MBG6088390.1 hypothetical protein [Actinomadura viridis]
MRTAPPSALTAALACAAAVLTGPAAAAHHGWEEFDTARPFYAAGTVASVRWGNPHPEVRLRVTRPVTLPGGLAGREIPAELEALGGRDVLRATRPLEGDDAEITLILAPVERLSSWGMPDRVRDGERLEVVGYAHREERGELRPELVIRQDGRAVRQRSVALPAAPAADGGGAGEAPSGDEAGGDGAAAPWVLGGLGALAAAGAVLLLARRARR